MTAEPRQPAAPHPHRRLVIKLMTVVTIFFAFGFALVPLYDAFCTLTGLNGKTSGNGVLSTGGIKSTASIPSRIDKTRSLSVEFTSTVMPGLPWEITPLTSRLELHPGELHHVLFRVRNRSDKTIVGQAIPSVSPGLAAQHFEKLDCFCFAQQTLAPQQTLDLPLSFIVQPEIDKDVQTITLAYAFFSVDDAKAATSTPAPSK